MMKNIINLIKSPLRQECGKGTLQYGRLLPICAEDAPQFSNDVYNKRYTREKIASRFQQSGRSMIEMLGVLAIVGVLSVGGIAGYSKAMQKYRTNKTIDQITQIINGVRALYSNQKNYEGISQNSSGQWDSGSSFMKKAKLLPESAWEDTNSSPKNPFGGEYFLGYAGRKSDGDNKAAQLGLNSIPDDACIELATQDWGAGEGLYSVGINMSDAIEGCSGSYSAALDYGQAIGCVGGDRVPLPIPMDVAISACASNNDNYLYFHFY